MRFDSVRGMATQSYKNGDSLPVFTSSPPGKCSAVWRWSPILTPQDSPTAPTINWKWMQHAARSATPYQVTSTPELAYLYFMHGTLRYDLESALQQHFATQHNPIATPRRQTARNARPVDPPVCALLPPMHITVGATPAPQKSGHSMIRMTDRGRSRKQEKAQKQCFPLFYFIIGTFFLSDLVVVSSSRLLTNRSNNLCGPSHIMDPFSLSSQDLFDQTGTWPDDENSTPDFEVFSDEVCKQKLLDDGRWGPELTPLHSKYGCTTTDVSPPSCPLKSARIASPR
nr:hypothetical protein CFP56_41353 [Quercus suber]